MRYPFFIFIILLQVTDATSVQAMRRGVKADYASKHPPESEDYEMRPMMSQSLPIGFSYFDGRVDGPTATLPPHASQTPPTQRRADPYKTSGEWTIPSPTSRKSSSPSRIRSFPDDEGSSLSRDSEFVLLMDGTVKDDLPDSAEEWGKQNFYQGPFSDSSEFVVGSPPYLASKVNRKGL